MKKNNSQNKPYYTQRKNKLKPNGACNVTAMIAALVAAGWAVEKLATKEFDLPADALMHFILSDKDVDRFWRRIDPSGHYPPNEWHQVLAYGTNLYLKKCGLLASGADAVIWNETRKLCDVIKALDDGGAAVLSGVFEAEGGKSIGHVVACVGYKKDDDGNVTHLILDDSWGDYHSKYAVHNGNDVEMSVEDFRTLIRHCNQDHKMAHIVKKAVTA